jgi:hypothetical protein
MTDIKTRFREILDEAVATALRTARLEALEEAAGAALLGLQNPRTHPYAEAEAREIADRIRSLKGE